MRRKPTPELDAEIETLDILNLQLRNDLNDPERCKAPRPKIPFMPLCNVIDLATMHTAVITYLDEVNDIAEITFANNKTKIVHDIQDNLQLQKHKFLNRENPLPYTL